MSNTDRDSVLERWADGMERLEQYYEGIYGPPATPPSLPPITTRDAMMEAIADGMERAKRNINKKSPTYHSDSVAYVKTVPAGNVHYASLEKIGGKTLVWNQLVQNGNFADTSGWTRQYGDISATDNVLTYTVTTANQNATIIGNVLGTITNHKYFIACDVKYNNTLPHGTVALGSGGYDNIYGTVTAANTWTNVAGIFARTSGGDDKVKLYLRTYDCTAGDTIDVRNVWCVDLTLMYGSGNEPTTVDEFTAQFPAQYYPYNAGTLLSAGVTSVVSKKADTTELATCSIPAEVQALTGYGLSAGSVYNYVDFERKVFVQRVGSVDMSDLTFGYGPSVGWSATLPNVKNPADDDTAFNGLSATLKATDRNTQATAFSGGTDAGMVSVAGGKVYVGTGSISIVPSGTLIYELDEPVETDISAYITEDNLISVEAGGALTFENQHGDDYRIDVPSVETFIVGEP